MGGLVTTATATVNLELQSTVKRTMGGDSNIFPTPTHHRKSLIGQLPEIVFPDNQIGRQPFCALRFPLRLLLLGAQFHMRPGG